MLKLTWWAELRAVGLVLLSSGSGLCEAEQHPEPAQALIMDLRRLVASHENSGWFIDRQHYEEIASRLLESMCRTPAEAREAAREAVLEEASRADARQLFARSGGQMDSDVERALTRERRAEAFLEALGRLDECPFFVLPSEDFRGRQTERDKWTLHLEGGGVAEAARSSGQLTLGGGGSGRLLVGRGLGDRFSLLVGGETGGGARLNRPGGASQFTVKYTAATPVVLRVHSLSWFYDAELAPLAMVQADNLALFWGGRVGVGLGLSATRTRDFLPWAGIAVTMDHFFPQDGVGASQVLRAGLRVGFRWMP